MGNATPLFEEMVVHQEDQPAQARREGWTKSMLHVCKAGHGFQVTAGEESRLSWQLDHCLTYPHFLSFTFDTCSLSCWMPCHGKRDLELDPTAPILSFDSFG
jgi:hypothetical protein